MAVAKGTLVADVVAADTVAGVAPCIMGTFSEGKSYKQTHTGGGGWPQAQNSEVDERRVKEEGVSHKWIES